MLGVGGKRTGSLVLRKPVGGGLVIEGDPPDEHVFPRKFLDRELNDAVRIRIVIPTEEPIVYEVTDIEAKGDLYAHRIKSEAVKKRRWWRKK